jgi:hypothetical protein
MMLTLGASILGGVLGGGLVLLVIGYIIVNSLAESHPENFG